MNEMYRTVEFTPSEHGGRLDKVLAAHFEQLSRNQVQALIRDGHVQVNGVVVKASYRIEAADRISVDIPVEEEETEPQPEAIPLDVLYEDDVVAAINKPAGMVVHPAYSHTSGTLVNAILARWPQIAGGVETDRAGIVHRLDKDTSGVILIAKTVSAQEDLKAQFKARTIQKRYVALVEGMPDTPEGRIEAPIGRDPNLRKRMAVLHDGREAITEFRLLKAYNDYTLLELFPKTGRTHQLRVHLAFIDHPIVGDTIYGRRKQGIKMKRHFLHAESITFTPPGQADPVTVHAPLPVGLQNILDKLPR